MPTPRAIVPASGQRVGRNRSGVDLAKSQIVRLDAANGVDAVTLATAATDTLYGVTTEIVINGADGNVQIAGKTVVISGNVVTIGQRLTTDGTGRAVPAAPGAGTNNGLIGLAITAAAGAAELIEVELCCPGCVIQG